MFDVNAEIEFEKCNIALGKVVDGEKLIAVAEDLSRQLNALQERIDELESVEDVVNADLEAITGKFEKLREVVLDAIVTLSRSRCDAKTRLKLAKSLESTVSNLE